MWAQNTLPAGDPKWFLNQFFHSGGSDNSAYCGTGCKGNNFMNLDSAAVDSALDALSLAEGQARPARAGELDEGRLRVRRRRSRRRLARRPDPAFAAAVGGDVEPGDPQAAGRLGTSGGASPSSRGARGPRCSRSPASMPTPPRMLATRSTACTRLWRLSARPQQPISQLRHDRRRHCVRVLGAGPQQDCSGAVP